MFLSSPAVEVVFCKADPVCVCVFWDCTAVQSGKQIDFLLGMVDAYIK